ncbi:uncharacterized protein Pyn_26199 [Prunus yedoensis var. nudiflora]|uniref:Uncharacterized protein n=1 Tax=Prunus yedoensis var. nudiflora TaxID=2094558 RepID=A0A314ZJW4_PRUYE|nr:uncharacterized protein Pyn_26199 [Prunus yedoensis var. nudiflora]
MEPNAGHDEFFERINLEGKSTGAAFFIRPGTGAETHSGHCCCINIYINSNVQGANNSFLDGSCVKMKDPGVHLFFGDVKLGKSFRRNKMKEREGERKRKPICFEAGARVLSHVFICIFPLHLVPFIVMSMKVRSFIYVSGSLGKI